MGLFDTMCDAAELIEEWERGIGQFHGDAGALSDFTGYPWDDLRKIKMEMLVIRQKESAPYPELDDSDYNWLRAEVLKRAGKKPPYDLEKVYSSCLKRLWKKRFPTREAYDAHCRNLVEKYTAAR